MVRLSWQWWLPVVTLLAAAVANGLLPRPAEPFADRFGRIRLGMSTSEVNVLLGRAAVFPMGETGHLAAWHYPGGHFIHVRFDCQGRVQEKSLVRRTWLDRVKAAFPGMWLPGGTTPSS
jgi:hypothetical protein